MKKNNSLLVISGYIDDDRPTGGVTMHVHRMLKSIIEPLVPNYVLSDYKKERLATQIRKISKADVMHIHATNAYLKLFYVIIGRCFHTKSIITVHGKYGMYGPLKNIVHRLALKACDIPILINEESFRAVHSFNCNAVLMPAFLPPIKNEEVLVPPVKEQIETIRGKGKPVFITNASSRAYTYDGKEIYGIDFLISFFSEHQEYSLIVLDPQNQYLPIYNDGLPENVAIIIGKHSFCASVELADVVVRNTPMDGDSFSVKESLCYNKPVLASDSVSRPSGVLLFHYNDKESFEAAIEAALGNSEKIGFDGEEAINCYIELYKKVGVIAG